MVKEVIVVEGRDDADAIKKALDAEIIITGGFGFPKDLMHRIKLAAERRGVIIFTDPDFAGEKIRNIISQKVKNCKHAFLPREKATKNDNIGIENAKPKDIIEALKKARMESTECRNEFTNRDLTMFGLIGVRDSAEKRDKLGKILRIGYCNSKQFLKRLNNYGITREEFQQGIERMNKYGEV